jgi:hypothetical protein
VEAGWRSSCIPPGQWDEPMRHSRGGQAMKAGYSEAAWRLFQPSLTARPGRNGVLTWADMELAGTPFGRTDVTLLVVRARGTH